MKAYNSLTKNIETIENKKLNIYLCGPTIYKPSHVGHLRTFLTFDLLERSMRYLGYSNMDWIMNITDINQKIVREFNAQSEEKNLMKFTDSLYNRFISDMKSIGFNENIKIYRISEHLKEIKDYIKTIIDNKYAYESNGSVYINFKEMEKNGFNMDPFKRSQDNSKHNEEKNYLSEKKDPRDFALWKKATKDDDPKYESDWGIGFPGWHIECSALIQHKLNKLDIHLGGCDLEFPHHNNEYLQHLAYSKERSWAKYFFHAGHVTVNGEKMANSEGNIITIKELFEKHDKNTIRMAFMESKWNNNLEINDSLFLNAQQQYKILYNLFLKQDILIKKANGAKSINDFKEKIKEKLSDNFNTKETVMYVRQIIKVINSEYKEFNKDSLTEIIKTIFNFYESMGFTFELKKLPNPSELINIIAEMRQEIRDIAKTFKKGSKDVKIKMFKLTDKIRDDYLKSLNIQIEDTPDGQLWIPK